MLVENVPYNADLQPLRFTRGAIEGLRLLGRHGFALIVAADAELSPCRHSAEPPRFVAEPRVARAECKICRLTGSSTRPSKVAQVSVGADNHDVTKRFACSRERFAAATAKRMGQHTGLAPCGMVAQATNLSIRALAGRLRTALTFGENRPMSEMLLKELAALDAPRPPSAARLAAEAFFAVPLPAGPQDVDTTVVVRRRETRVAEGEPVALGPREAEPREAQEARTPRVFRIDAGAPAEVAHVAAPAEPAVGQAPQPVDDGAPANPPQRRLPRKKARRLHGEVTIIRPVQGETSQGNPSDLPVDAQPPAPDRRIELASPRAAQRRPKRAVAPTDDAWPHYPRLMARIRALEMEAKALKESEAAAAVEWIKRAIATHGLTAQDLGFADHRPRAAAAPDHPDAFGVVRSSRRHSR